MKIFQKIFFIFFIIISFFKISNETSLLSKIKIISEEIIQVSCDSHFFYISMKISSSSEIINPITFELNLISPSNTRMKCIVFNTKFECFSFVPDGFLYRQEELFFNLFYTPPKIEKIEFDLKSFRKNIRRWENTTMCGYDNYLLNDTLVDYSEWKKFRIFDINGNDCKYYYEDKEQKNMFYFNMSLGIEDNDIIDFLQKNNENSIQFIQEIKVPISLRYQEYQKTDFISTKDYFFCQNNELISINNYQNLKFLCKLNIPRKTILNSEIKLQSFFDKVYIKKSSNEYETINIFFNVTNSYYIDENKTSLISQNYLILNDGDINKNIICPNVPIFTIKTKESGIYYNSYSKDSNIFTFYLKGTLSNGYKYINKTLSKISELYSDISFPLYLLDNSLEITDNSEIKAKCTLASGSLFYDINTLIECIGEKRNLLNENNTSDNESRIDVNKNQIIDLSLNYIKDKNNLFNNIIINWPEKQFFGNKKNIYSYKISALSLQQKYVSCDEGNYLTFYINIYNLKKEPKIFFNLPLSSPEGYEAFCELFDKRTLQCTIDLRYKKIVKGEKISLIDKKEKLRIINDEGNEIIFGVNDKNNFYVMKDDCGENVYFGAMKEMGISKKKGIIISIGLGLFFLFLIGFCIFYFIHCILRCKKRGKKLPMTEESKIQKDDIIK